jgi:hypothetical protein
MVAPPDVARFLVAFGLVPLLLARVDVSRLDPPWAFALTPTWTTVQFIVIALAGVVLGATSGRPVHGLAAVAIGLLSGLAVDLWWLAGWVKPYDQTFVTMLTQAAWRSDLTAAALTLIVVASVGFGIGAFARPWLRDRSAPARRRPDNSEVVALGVAVIVAPLLAIGIASAAASSALVVPDGAQIQAVSVSPGGIAVDPVVLRPGPTRFRCQYAQDATPDWAGLVAVPEGVESVPASFDTTVSTCGSEPGSLTWGTTGELVPGRYVWIQIEQTEVPHIVSRSPVVIVAR